MRIVLEQIYGSQETLDLQIVKPKLLLEQTRECDALAVGWGIYKDQWYLCRSTRLKVAEYESPKPIKTYSVQLIVGCLEQNLLDEVRSVYRKFLEIKKFSPIYEFDADLQRSAWILVSKENSIRAFTKLQLYDGGIESNITAWDYSEPKASIGRKLINYEIDIAKSLNYDYLYIGPGYNNSSIYKSSLHGFEWWTGDEWSTDIDKYINLCNRDDTITTLQDLSNLHAI